MTDEEQGKYPPDRCANCGDYPEKGDYKLLLCKQCRDSLANRSFPAWINASALVLILIFIYSLITFPPAINTAIAFERGKRAEASNDYKTAVSEYTKICSKYPKSTEPYIRLSVVQYKSGNLREADRILSLLEGSYVSEEQTIELNQVADGINTYIRNNGGPK
ncbi:MAG: hypothetical protein ACYC27_20515 [Armatimonadota bacterium]